VIPTRNGTVTRGPDSTTYAVRTRPGWVLAGIDLKTAQTRLGHSDPRLTLTVYAQPTTEAEKAAAAALHEWFRASRAVS